MTAHVPQEAVPDRGQFRPQAGFVAAALPTVMRKVHDLAAATLRDV